MEFYLWHWYPPLHLSSHSIQEKTVVVVVLFLFFSLQIIMFQVSLGYKLQSATQKGPEEAIRTLFDPKSPIISS